MRPEARTHTPLTDKSGEIDSIVSPAPLTRRCEALRTRAPYLPLLNTDVKFFDSLPHPPLRGQSV